MHAQLLADVIKARFDMKRTMFIKGPPGCGKTQIPKQVAAEMRVGFKTVHAPLMQPEDYGLPVVNAARTGVDFVVPTEKFPLEHSSCEEEGILLLDELPQCDTAGQKILANLVQEREIHGRRLKPGWMIVATGNRSSDRAGANRVLSHLSNRMTTYELEPHLDSWTAWALSNGVAPEVVAFIRFKPDFLCEFDPARDQNPSPRAWAEGVSQAMGRVPPDAEFETFKGDVGEGPASEFLAFLKTYRDLPDPDAILLNPDAYPVPSDRSTLYALCGALAHRATDVNAERLLRFTERMPPEFEVLVVRDATRINRKFPMSAAFMKWSATRGRQVLL